MTQKNTAINAIQGQGEAALQKTHLLAAAASGVYISNLTLLQTGSVIVSAILIGFAIYFIIKTDWLKTRVNRFQDVILKTDLPKKEAQKMWTDVQKHFFAGSENDLKIAVIEADKILDEALRGAGITGVSLGDRLKKIKPSQIPDIDAVWQAHKLRNRIAHESDFKLKRDLAERALGIYEKTLRGFKVLD